MTDTPADNSPTIDPDTITFVKDAGVYLKGSKEETPFKAGDDSLTRSDLDAGMLKYLREEGVIVLGDEKAAVSSFADTPGVSIGEDINLILSGETGLEATLPDNSSLRTTETSIDKILGNAPSVPAAGVDSDSTPIDVSRSVNEPAPAAAGAPKGKEIVPGIRDAGEVEGGEQIVNDVTEVTKIDLLNPPSDQTASSDPADDDLGDEEGDDDAGDAEGDETGAEGTSTEGGESSETAPPPPPAPTPTPAPAARPQLQPRPQSNIPNKPGNQNKSGNQNKGQQPVKRG